jgi:hypothetical protein
MKKSKIKEAAEKLMKDKGVDTVHATSDGQLFFEKNAAELHRDTNAKGDKLTVFTFGAADAAEAPEGSEASGKKDEAKPLNAKDTIAKIATIEDVKELDALQAAEVAGQNRKTVIDAIGARNAALQPDGGQKNDEQRKNDEQ